MQYPIQIWGFPAVVLLIILVQFLRRGRIKADTDEDQKEAARDLVILNVILFTPLIVIFLILLITGGNIGIGGLGLVALYYIYTILLAPISLIVNGNWIIRNREKRRRYKKTLMFSYFSTAIALAAFSYFVIDYFYI